MAFGQPAGTEETEYERAGRVEAINNQRWLTDLTDTIYFQATHSTDSLLVVCETQTTTKKSVECVD